jgi:hypothetical protein
VTEAEVIDSMTQYFGLVADMLTLYLTATTGYLVVAYLVGKQLTRSQLVIISGLYLVFAFISAYLAVGYGMRGLHYAQVLNQLSPSTPLYATDAVPIALCLALLGGIIASYKFMWDMRHPKPE